MRKALEGEEVVLARDHRPLVRLAPIRQPQKRRKPGSAKGQVWMSADFDDELSDFDEYSK